MNNKDFNNPLPYIFIVFMLSSFSYEIYSKNNSSKRKDTRLFIYIYRKNKAIWGKKKRKRYYILLLYIGKTIQISLYSNIYREIQSLFPAIKEKEKRYYYI